MEVIMPKWLSGAAFYEIYPQSFFDSNGDGIGDLEGIRQKLDYVKSLGVSAIWLNPCFDSPFMDAGYDVRDYYKVAPRYGTNEELKNLFAEAHKKDLKIILDLVPGHTSDQCEWFLKSREAGENEYSDRYIWTQSVWDAPGEYRLINGAAPRDGNYMVNFFSCQPALNYGFYNITRQWQSSFDSPQAVATREAIKDVMRFWLDMGADGFRVDMADSLVKNDPDKVATSLIYKDIRKTLDEEYPEAVIISEWSDPLKSLKAGFHADFYLDHDNSAYRSLFRDEKSFFSKEGKGDIAFFTEKYEKHLEATKNYGFISFITCNHDTPRMSRTFSPRECMLAYCAIFTLPGVPFLYYGDEIGMRFLEGLKSKEGAFSRTGTRTPMQWAPGKNLGFSEADEIYLPTDPSPDAPTVSEAEKNPDSILNKIREIIKLRNANEDLQADGQFEIIYAKKNKYPFIFKRGRFIAAINPSMETTSVRVDFKGAEAFKIGGYEISNGLLILTPQSMAVIKI
jgi:maltose alpha-D-glucosyltransferase/alpha-amylase